MGKESILDAFREITFETETEECEEVTITLSHESTLTLGNTERLFNHEDQQDFYSILVRESLEK